MDACLLNNKVTFPWLQAYLVDSLNEVLDLNQRKDTDLLRCNWTGSNFFDPIAYKQKVRADQGKSVYLAN